ncbi:DUF3313 family protein [Burkholderia sp. BCC1988]|uniref:DUF3313 family protein n=1 Tax=Burkholderia sp. BCC1988 TaxID=2817443 RepID=UPI002AB27B32|nr:DUF3313 family protein [Burkholderia sp. BCC1988]
MFRTRLIPFFVSSAAALTLTACASVQPVAYSGLASSSQLAQNRDSDAAKVPYRYADQVNWSKYRQVIVDPVVVYAGQDNQFGDLKADDKAALADSPRLLTAYVTKQYPNAMNLPAAFGSLSAAKTGIDKGADALVSQLQ